MARYRFSYLAEQDLQEIAEYLGKHSPKSAERVLEALRETFVMLGSSPLAGTLRDDIRPNLRVFTAIEPQKANVT